MIEVIGIRIVFYFTNNSSKTFLNTKKQKKTTFQIILEIVFPLSYQ